MTDKVDGLVLVGDEAWDASEWAAEQKRRANRRRSAEYWREYRKRKGESYRAYQREWSKRRRTYQLTDAELEDKIRWHQRLIDRYSRELELRRKAA